MATQSIPYLHRQPEGDDPDATLRLRRPPELALRDRRAMQDGAAPKELTKLGETWSSPLPAPPRLLSVDVLRGLVIVLMALDHVREYVCVVRGIQTDVTAWPFFLTRWVTHFCAPTFCLLAGASAFLALGRRRSVGALSRFLLLRGLWLVAAELSIVGVGWSFNLRYPFEMGFTLQVIWSLGVSMIVLAGLVHLPLGAIAAFGVVMVAGHNLLDGIAPGDLGAWAPLWQVLHVQGPLPIAFGPVHVFVAYPLVPWIGVMALGYALGAILTRPADVRRRTLVSLGVGLTLAFVVLRAANVYGDPSRWSVQATMVSTVLSFVDTTKYPPSLLYLLMTLGPAVVVLARAERWTGAIARVFADFGRVPFFFYVAHLYLIHTLAIGLGWLQGFPLSVMVGSFLTLPKDYGVSLAAVYAIWFGVVLLLYPACRAFGRLKATSRQPWLSYL